MFRQRITLLALIASTAALTAPPARAADGGIPIRAAGADGRFQTQHDLKTRTLRYAPATVTAFRQRFDPLVAALEAMPTVNTPTAPLCMRSMTWIEVESDRAVEGSVSLLRPVILDGRCSPMTSGGTVVTFNRLAMLRTKMMTGEDGGPEWWRVPMVPAGPNAYTIVDDGERWEVMTHGRAPLFTDVTIGRYLQRRLKQVAGSEGAAAMAFTQADFDRWYATDFPREAARTRAEMAGTLAAVADPTVRAQMREAVEAGIAALVEVKRTQVTVATDMRESAGGFNAGTLDDPAAIRAALARLSPAEQALPACAADDGGFVGNAGCAPGDRLVEANPGYFDPKRPAAIQLVMLQTPDKPFHGEGPQEADERMAIWAAIDRAALRKAVE